MIDLENLRRSFSDNFLQFGELGAALSVWRDGEEILSIYGGQKHRETQEPWEQDTLVLWWSATKGPAAACVLHLLQEQGLDPSLPVSCLWPEFAQKGKGDITIAQLMSHQAGLAAVPGKIIPPTDHDAMASALAAQEPLWEVGKQHGYHPRTFGALLDECARRLTGGVTLGEYWRSVFAEPLRLEFWIGLPEALHPRVATIYASRTPNPPESDLHFYKETAKPGSLQNLAFSAGAAGPVSVMNKPEFRSASLPALGGIGSASALAKFYAMLASGGELEGRRFFSEKTMGWMRKKQTQGMDAVFLSETAFSCGFMLDPVSPDGKKTRHLFGPSLTGFGHPGAGGGLAFADVEHRIAFAYGMNQMSLATLPIRRAGHLVKSLYKSL